MISWNGHVNASAIGADIDRDELELKFRVYCPSDTERNLRVNPRFTYSLTDNPRLLFKAALTGNNQPVCELNKGEILAKDDFHYPRDATRVYFCQLKDSLHGTVTDEYGSSEYYEHTASILHHHGDGVSIGREDPHIDAMVYASRYNLVDGEKIKNEIRQRVKKILKGEKGDLTERILMHVEGGEP